MHIERLELKNFRNYENLQIDFDDKRYPDLKDYGINLVKNALNLSCNLGLGAMTTRGFGRMQHTLIEM